MIFYCRCFDSGVYSGISQSDFAPFLAQKLGVEQSKLVIYHIYQPHDLKLHNESKKILEVPESIG